MSTGVNEEFYHSTFDGVPRLAPYVQFLNDNPDIRINCRSKNPLFRLLGINDWKTRVLTDQNFGARVVYSPAGGPCGRVALLPTHLMSYYAKQHLHNQPSLRNTIVLIKRSTKRWFNNHDTIAHMLRKEASARRLRFFEFRDDPVPKFSVARSAFHNAIIIVAPHGAGESNIVYSQPGTVLIEGLCFVKESKINPCFQRTAYSLGLRYFALFDPQGCFNVTAEQVRKPVRFYLDHLNEL
jgi:hypothetical protein